MLTLKKNLLYILLFGFLCITVQSVYSAAPDLYNGRVKYGTYHCVRNGGTCDYERYDNGEKFTGNVCPSFDKDIPFEEQNKKIADFLNSRYCNYTPSTIKKYKCKYNDGSATVYMQEGTIIAVKNSTSIERAQNQNFFDPNRCTEIKMEGDNSEPSPDTPNNNNVNNASQDENNNSDYISGNEVQIELAENEAEGSAVDRIPSLNNEITSLRNEVEELKKQIKSQEQSLNIMYIFLAILFIIILIYIFKSNNDPYKRL